VIVLVTGDRAWSDGPFISDVLDALDVTTLFEGCATGADRWAGDHEWYDQHDTHEGWARVHNIETRHFPADWGRYKFRKNLGGNPAGPIRNRDMLDAALRVGLDLVVAFHDEFAKSRGTRDMVKIARAAQIPVVLHSHTKVIRYDPALTLPLDL
jgi:hypothetical protein